MKQVDKYKSPRKNKDASTINDSEYYKSDEHEVEISDSSKQVEASKEPIKKLTLSIEFLNYQA